ncbi:MAG: TolC family outer membrane protein [Magnetococcus sp. DMHC-8]
MVKIAGKTVRRRRQMLALAAGILISFQAVPAWSLTLREATELAVKTYPDVQAAEEYGKALDQKVQQSLAGYLPRMDFTAGYGPEKSDNSTTRGVNTAAGNPNAHWLTMKRGEMNLLVKQNVFDGFDVRTKVAQAKAQLESARARLDLTIENVALMAVNAYVDLVMKHIQLELIKDNVLLHQRIMAKVQQKFEGGAGPEADVNQAKSRTFLASANHASNQTAYKNAQAKFTEIVGLPPLKEQEMLRPLVPEKLLPKSVEEAVEAALRDNAELEAGRANVTAADASLANAKAAMYPKLDLELSAANNANVGGSEQHGQSAAAMLKMNYNAFSGGADVARIQEQRNMLEQARKNLEKSQRTLDETTREAWNKLTMAQNRIGFLRQHYEVSKRVTASYHDQFKMGKRTLLDVLNSENELFAAKNGLLFEELAYIKGAYELFAKMGMLREALAAEPAPTPEQRILTEKDPAEQEASLVGAEGEGHEAPDAGQSPPDGQSPKQEDKAPSAANGQESPKQDKGKDKGKDKAKSKAKQPAPARPDQLAPGKPGAVQDVAPDLPPVELPKPPPEPETGAGDHGAGQPPTTPNRDAAPVEPADRPAASRSRQTQPESEDSSGFSFFSLLRNWRWSDSAPQEAPATVRDTEPTRNEPGHADATPGEAKRPEPAPGETRQSEPAGSEVRRHAPAQEAPVEQTEPARNEARRPESADTGESMPVETGAGQPGAAREVDADASTLQTTPVQSPQTYDPSAHQKLAYQAVFDALLAPETE